MTPTMQVSYEGHRLLSTGTKHVNVVPNHGEADHRGPLGLTQHRIGYTKNSPQMGAVTASRMRSRFSKGVPFLPRLEDRKSKVIFSVQDVVKHPHPVDKGGGEVRWKRWSFLRGAVATS